MLSYPVRIALIAALGGFLFGFETAVMELLESGVTTFSTNPAAHVTAVNQVVLKRFCRDLPYSDITKLLPEMHLH